MKIKTQIRNIIVLTIMISASFLNAQEIDFLSLLNNVNIDTRTINGTTTYDGQNAGTVGFGGSYFGYNAGATIDAAAFYDTFMGSFSGYNTTTGNYNTFVGTAAGLLNTTGSNNTSLGFLAGYSNATGIGNLFLGYYAGFNETGSDKLYIENTLSAIPLIYGDFLTNKVGINTKNLVNSVGGANTSAYGLYVKGGILTEEVRVRIGWADYVFDEDYDLRSLVKVEEFIAKNGHLPNIPSSKQVKEQGIELGDIARLQQEKIEELTLYVIQQQKEIDQLKVIVNELNKKD